MRNAEERPAAHADRLVRTPRIPIWIAGCIAALILALPGSSPGITDPAKEVIDCLRAEYGDLAGFSVAYEREIVSSSMALLGGPAAGDHASGCIYFRPPHYLKIAQKAPKPETVVTNGETLWWYLPHKQEVHRYRSEDVGRELSVLADVFRGLKEVSESFEFLWEGHDENGDRRIRLVPDPPWAETDHISLSVTPACRLRVVEIHNTVGNVTRFILGPLEPRETFEEGFFTFSVPEGVRVLDESP